MAAPDWLTYWGAALSSALALREVLKHRRATRPMLVGYIGAGPSDGTVIEHRGGGTEDSGEARAVVLHNRGGASTTVQNHALFVPARWCPGALLGVLGELGWTPGAKHETKHLRLRELAVVIDAGADGTVRVMLWTHHRDALAKGRLMLNVSHSWSRERPQQITVRRSA